MAGLRFLAAIALAGGCAALGLTLFVDRFVAPVDDIVLGGTGLAVAIALAAAALLLRGVSSRILPLFGILPALVVALYASWLLDPAATDLPERTNLLFGIGLTFLWIIESALRFERGTRAGVIGALLLFVAIPLQVVGASSDDPGRLTTPAIGAAATGLLLVAAWAAAVAAWVRTGGRLTWEAPAIEPPGSKLLDWKWSRQLPDGVPWLVGLAGVAAVAGGLVRSTIGVDAERPALALVQAAFGVLWASSVVRIVRAAPKVGQLTSAVLVIADIAVPLGLLLPAVTGGLALVGPLIGAEVSRSGATTSVPNEELVAGALAFVGISLARLAWVLRSGARIMGIVAGLSLMLGGVLVVGGASSADTGLLGAGRITVALAWVVAGFWLIALGRRLRGTVPLAVFRPPADREGVAEPPLRVAGRARRSRTGTRRAARWGGPERKPFARRPKTAPRHDLVELARRLGAPPGDLGAFTPRYTTFTIKKRSGGRRSITAPDPATKALQRRILQRLLARLPAHPAAHGFERGRSIVTNAAVHVNPAVLVKLDVEDFFGRTRTARIRRYWRVIGWDREAAAVLTRLTTQKGGLPQGAPTSPRLANLVNVRLDARLAGIARIHGAAYSRYADDIAFSFATDDGPAVRQLIHAVRRAVWSEGRYRLHVSRKVEIRRRHERQSVTGLVVNAGPPRLDRARRRWLRAVEHRRYSGGTPTIDDAALHGWQSLEAMIETQAAAAAAAHRSSDESPDVS